VIEIPRRGHETKVRRDRGVDFYQSNPPGYLLNDRVLQRPAGVRTFGERRSLIARALLMDSRYKLTSGVGAAILCALSVAAAACGGGTAASTPSTHRGELSVSSSIDSGAVLARPLVWRAAVSPGSDVVVEHVDFLIDGQLRWTEQQEPYEFNDGRLFAPWPLGAGSHTLSVRAVTSTGLSAQTASTVTVKTDRRAAALPAGRYYRSVTNADVRRVSGYRDAAHGAFGEVTTVGRWVMRVRADGVIVLDVVPAGEYDGFYLPYLSQGGRLTLYGPAVWLQPHPDQSSLFCDPEPPASYRLAEDGQRLTVTPIGHTCADRDTAPVGTWRRG